MGGNIPGGNFLGENFPGGNFPGGSLMGGNFPRGNFPRTLENGTELIVCTEEQIQKLLIYFELKRYLSLKKHLISVRH